VYIHIVAVMRYIAYTVLLLPTAGVHILARACVYRVAQKPLVTVVKKVPVTSPGYLPVLEFLSMRFHRKFSTNLSLTIPRVATLRLRSSRSSPRTSRDETPPSLAIAGDGRHTALLYSVRGLHAPRDGPVFTYL